MLDPFSWFQRFSLNVSKATLVNLYTLISTLDRNLEGWVSHDVLHRRDEFFWRHPFPGMILCPQKQTRGRSRGGASSLFNHKQAFLPLNGNIQRQAGLMRSIHSSRLDAQHV